MIRFTRGTKVNFTTIFYDSSGDAALPSSGNLVVSYPAKADCWPMDGSCRTASTTALAVVSTVDKTWSASWSSSVSKPGMIQWTIYASSNEFTTEDGEFLLLGNAANSTAL